MKKIIMPVLILFVAAIISITYSVMKKTVTVVVDGKETQYTTFKTSVGELLESNNIALDSKDKIEPGIDSKLVEHGRINIKKAVNVKVSFDGEVKDIKSTEDTVESMLKAEGIEFKPEDKISPKREESIKDGMEISITRVDTKMITEKVVIGFKEVVKMDPRLPNTKRNVAQEGREGEKKLTVSIVYENGKEVSRRIVDETITKQPMDRIIVAGGYPSMPVSRGGDVMPYAKIVKVKATAYWAVNGVGKTYTASGRKAVRNPDGYSTIAVDRSVFPFGTKLFVEGYGFAVAAETGTAIIGDKIDVFFDTYKEACDWGVKYVNVYVLK